MLQPDDEAPTTQFGGFDWDAAHPGPTGTWDHDAHTDPAPDGTDSWFSDGDWSDDRWDDSWAADQPDQPHGGHHIAGEAEEPFQIRARYREPGTSPSRGGKQPTTADKVVDEVSSFAVGLADATDSSLSRLERLPSTWMADRAPDIIRIGLGITYTLFGLAKFAPDVSPAETMIESTFVRILGVAGFEGASTAALFALAAFEVIIGLGLLFDVRRLAVVWLIMAHLVGTLIPLAVVPQLTWERFPYALTMEGQYILTNLMLGAAALAVGAAAARGSRRPPRPGVSSDYRRPPGPRPVTGERPPGPRPI